MVTNACRSRATASMANKSRHLQEQLADQPMAQVIR